MDLRKIKKLIELVEESGITELEVKSGDEAVRIVRPGVGAMVPEVGREAEPEPVPPTTAMVRVTVQAPMAGTLYAAPSPGAAAFVQVGAEVGVGDILCIIESMKMMNEIPAQSSGRVVEILVQDGEPVAAGQPLFRIA